MGPEDQRREEKEVAQLQDQAWRPPGHGRASGQHRQQCGVEREGAPHQQKPIGRLTRQVGIDQQNDERERGQHDAGAGDEPFPARMLVQLRVIHDRRIKELRSIPFDIGNPPCR